MPRLVFFTAMLAAIILAPPAAFAEWTCNARGLVSASYDGGSSAYIHLQGFRGGKDYAVTKSRNGKVARGRTTNGTPFTCRKTG